MLCEEETDDSAGLIAEHRRCHEPTNDVLAYASGTHTHGLACIATAGPIGLVALATAGLVCRFSYGDQLPSRYIVYVVQY